ncbi:hypothetical protein F8R15_19470 [Thioclava sp. JE_KL1]|nr:hypothetical protein [Thioclava sp. JE_KL1]
MRRFYRFLKHQDGAVTIEWVVLTASVVALAVSVGSYLDGTIFTELKGILLDAVSNGTQATN